MGQDKRFLLRLGILALGLLAIFALAPACSRGPQPPAEKGKDAVDTVTQSIINGRKDLGHPAAGALVDNAKNPFCSGTLIAPRVVLTAAHCVDAFAQLTSPLSFRMDIPIDENNFKSVFYEIDQTESKRHPQYSGTMTQNIANDIAVLVLKQPVFEITPIPFNQTKMDQTWVGKKLLFMGYGRLSASDTQPSKIKYSTFLTINGVDPTPAKVNTVAYEGTNTSVCQGDSGGPALAEINGQTFVVGVTSHGTNANCTGTSYSYRSDPYVSFIQGFLDKFSSCAATPPSCGKCATCDQKTCKPKAVSAESTNCKVCKSNADCGTGTCVRIGSGMRCAQACDTDSCCPADSICTTDANNRSYCLPNTMQCPDVACTQDTDCSSSEECKGGVCTLKLPKLEGSTCQPCADSKECGQGGYCDTPDGRGGRCLQACEAGTDLCPEGFICKQLTPGLKSCLPKDGTCYVICKQPTDCKGGLSCVQGICQRPGGAEVGEPCDAQLKCKSDLSCIKGANGSRCYQPCGVAKGQAGAPCKEGNVCDAGLRCFPNPLGGQSICVEPCQNNSDCKNGGACQSFVNACVCQSDSQCTNGATCNPIISGFGTCAKSQLKPCPSNEECTSSPGSESYCVPKGSGTRSAGQSCDNVNRCQEGLACIPGLNICIEDCTATDKCQNGGNCQSLIGTQKFCLCGNDAACGTGRQCQVVAQGMGYCKKQETEGCTPGDCPPGLVCKEKKCVPGEKPKPEPTPEPKPEPTPDAAPSEPATPDTTAKPDAAPSEGTTKDSTGNTNDNGGIVEGPPSKSCGCQQTQPTHVPLSLVLLLLVLPWLRRMT